ncbi:TVP38/TMEM64 family protein [Chengkuizengella axinellae]|uniref:TVP38/TMEM64 family membrane protein n=1 Tax=Chengkuizengella axinellae TaxID=3064388 RepID=A0ABT9J2I7_9BACL|nr:TVP38/TMEM64 family protein [Chengkuizengella sp. 2205SS18-9]MDP5275793.1 TVP38/TMEM64 family protein [Chengkuizengella sp. 2205SS18-9]
MNRSIKKLLLFALLVAVGITILFVFDLRRFTPENIRDFILSFGVWAPILYIFLYTVRPLIFFPAIVLTLSGGYTFGPWWGTLYDLIGATMGACLAFIIARTLGRETIERWLGDKIKKMDDISEEKGFKTILFIRLVPLIPFDVINYGAGLSKVKLKDYALATLIGILPGAFAYNYLGASFHNFSTEFYFAIALVLILMLVPTIYKWSKKKKKLANIKG